MMALATKADQFGRYIEDATFRTVALVVACIGFFLIALVGVRGEDTRSDAGATKADVAIITSQLGTITQTLEEAKVGRHEQTVKIHEIKQNLAQIQELLRANGLTP